MAAFPRTAPGRTRWISCRITAMPLASLELIRSQSWPSGNRDRAKKNASSRGNMPYTTPLRTVQGDHETGPQATPHWAAFRVADLSMPAMRSCCYAPGRGRTLNSGWASQSHTMCRSQARAARPSFDKKRRNLHLANIHRRQGLLVERCNPSMH